MNVYEEKDRIVIRIQVDSLAGQITICILKSTYLLVEAQNEYFQYIILANSTIL